MAKPKALATYPYDEGVMKEFALVYMTQRADLNSSNVDILDPVALKYRTLYYDSTEEVLSALSDMMNTGDRVLMYKVYATRLCLDISKWRPTKL